VLPLQQVPVQVAPRFAHDASQWPNVHAKPVQQSPSVTHTPPSSAHTHAPLRHALEQQSVSVSHVALTVPHVHCALVPQPAFEQQSALVRHAAPAVPQTHAPPVQSSG
jgi:hypothetical protein